MKIEIKDIVILNLVVLLLFITIPNFAGKNIPKKDALFLFQTYYRLELAQQYTRFHNFNEHDIETMAEGERVFYHEKLRVYEQMFKEEVTMPCLWRTHVDKLLGHECIKVNGEWVVKGGQK